MSWPQITQDPENIQRFFRLQNCLSRRSSMPRKYSKTFSPADLSLPQIIDHPEIFKNFFTCKNVLAANHQQPGNNQEHFRLQNCLGRKSSISRKHSQTFSPSELSWPQIIDTPKIFKNFFTCRSVLAADHQQHGNIQIFSTCRTLLATNHQQPGNSQRNFHRQKYLSLKLSTTWKHSMFFSPAELSQLQIIIIAKKFKDFFVCKTVLSADHRCPENIQTVFHLQICLSGKSSRTRKYSNTFSPADMSQSQIINNLEKFKDFFACRILLDADHQQPGKIKYFFACKTVLAASHHYPENIQRIFRLQNCLGRRSSITRKYSKTFSPADLSLPQIMMPRKYSKTFSPADMSQSQIINNLEKFKDFFACRSLLDVDHQQPGKNQRFFRPQNCLSRRSSIPRKYANSFSPADVSWPQIIFIQKIFKDFFACKTVLAADHRCPGNIQTLFHLQIWLNRKSSTTWKNSKTFWPAEMSQPQIINNLEIIRNIFACKIVSAANHQYPENIHSFFRLQNCLGRRSSTTWKYSNLFHMQNSLSHKSSTTWKQSTTFSPVEISQSQIINNMETFKIFLACKIV